MCERVTMPGGAMAIICGARHGRRPPCDDCGAPAEFECDGSPRRPGRKTCDRPLCRRCRIHVPPNQDFCKDHRAQAHAAAAQLRLFGGAASFERVK